MTALYGLVLVFKDKERREYNLTSGWKWDADLLKRFIRFGVPSGMQWALEGLAFSIFLIFIGRMVDGSAALSASSIVVTVMMLSILPAMGVAQSTSVLVGQYLGEKRPQDAESAVWSGWQVTLIYIIIVGFTFVLFPGFYAGWFRNNEDAAMWLKVSQMIPWLLIFVAIFTTSDSMNMVFAFSLKGAGDTKFVTIVALLLPWPLMVLPAYLFREQGITHFMLIEHSSSRLS